MKQYLVCTRQTPTRIFPHDPLRIHRFVLFKMYISYVTHAKSVSKFQARFYAAENFILIFYFRSDCHYVCNRTL